MELSASPLVAPAHLLNASIVSLGDPLLVAPVLRRLRRGKHRNLKAAIGLGVLASEVEVHKQVKKLLRLLHPDYSINQPLKGTKKHARIEAAFKKLNGLREACG